MTRTTITDPAIIVEGNALKFGVIVSTTRATDGSISVRYFSGREREMADATVPVGSKFVYIVCDLLTTPEGNPRLAVNCPTVGLNATYGEVTDMIGTTILNVPESIELADLRVQVYGDLLNIRFDFAADTQPDPETIERLIRLASQYYADLMSAQLNSGVSLVVGIARSINSLPIVPAFAVTAN